MGDIEINAVLVGLIVVLLILDIIIAIIILKIVLSIRRFSKLIDAVVDDIEAFQKIITKIRFPRSLAQVVRAVAGWLPDKNSNNDKKNQDK